MVKLLLDRGAKIDAKTKVRMQHFKPFCHERRERLWFINAVAAPGWPDASSLWGKKRARTGGGDPAGPRGSVPIQDQGSYWDVTFGGTVHLGRRRKAMSHFITFRNHTERFEGFYPIIQSDSRPVVAAGVVVSHCLHMTCETSAEQPVFAA